MNQFQSPPQMGAQISMDVIRSAPFVTCECGGQVFAEKIMFKKLSAIISPSGKEEVRPMPVLLCEKCGKIPATFDGQNLIPEALKAKKPSADETLKVVK